MILIILMALLLFQAPSGGADSNVRVTTREFKKYDCQTGKRLKAKPLVPSTVLVVDSHASDLLKVRVLMTDEFLCIKADAKDLISVQPARLPNGDEVPFPDTRKGITAPHVREKGKLPTPPQRPSHSPITEIRGIEIVAIFVVNIDGTVPICRVARGSGFPEWDAWACKRVQTKIFEPAKKDGIPIAVTMTEFSQTTFH